MADDLSTEALAGVVATAVAHTAVEMATREPCTKPEMLAAGRSSSAWRASSSSGEWVVRVPIPRSGRILSYHAEAGLGDLLSSAGHPVATWTVVDVDGTPCSVAPLLPGTPVDYGQPFSADFAVALAYLLRDLHGLPATGFGPLVDTDEALRGRSNSATNGVVDRWFHARVWPFDHASLIDHPVMEIAPKAATYVQGLRSQILAAAAEPFGVLHSDLHRQHLLCGSDGHLTGVLDFGDAFVGSVAWDFALLHWYYGRSNAELVAKHYPAGVDISERGRCLALAVGLYKMAKTPADPTVPERLNKLLDDMAEQLPM